MTDSRSEAGNAEHSDSKTSEQTYNRGGREHAGFWERTLQAEGTASAKSTGGTVCCLEKNLQDLHGWGSVSEGKCGRQWGVVWRWARPCTALQTLVNSWVFLWEKWFIVTLSREATCSGLALKGSLAGVFHYIIGQEWNQQQRPLGACCINPGKTRWRCGLAGEQAGRGEGRIPAVFCIYGQGGFCNGERSIRDCPKALGFSNCEKGDACSWDNKGWDAMRE